MSRYALINIILHKLHTVHKCRFQHVYIHVPFHLGGYLTFLSLEPAEELLREHTTGGMRRQTHCASRDKIYAGRETYLLGHELKVVLLILQKSLSHWVFTSCCTHVHIESSHPCTYNEPAISYSLGLKVPVQHVVFSLRESSFAFTDTAGYRMKKYIQCTLGSNPLLSDASLW